jgi:hypothetical protein
MNERILELAIEARKYAETKPDIYSVAYDKKFAELIVRECAKIADSADESACEWIGGNILTHFGVEE